LAAPIRDCQVQSLGREVDHDDRRDVGCAESVSRDERHLAKPDFGIGAKICNPLAAAFYEGWDLLVIVRTGNRASLEPGIRSEQYSHNELALSGIERLESIDPASACRSATWRWYRARVLARARLLFLHFYTAFATQAITILFRNVLAVDDSTLWTLLGLERAQHRDARGHLGEPRAGTGGGKGRFR
jgi:hypothetical protein